MTMLLVISWVVVAGLLLLTVAIRPVRTKHSMFELQRKKHQAVIDREYWLGDIYAFRRVVAVTLLVTLVFTGWSLWQQWGIIVTMVSLVILGLLSRWHLVERYAMHQYAKYEPTLLRLAQQWPTVGWLLGSERREAKDFHLESPEHLVHLVDTAGHVLMVQQRQLILRSLYWHTGTVADIMTPVDKIVSVKHRELLGPLVLDDLHKSGHYRFPVIRADIDDVIGTVNITEMLRVDMLQKSHTAEKIMTPIEVRVSKTTKLPDALSTLLAHPGQLGLVVDDDGRTVGLVTVEDVLKALLG